MNKLKFILFLIPALICCKKETIDLQRVTFNYEMVESHSMVTKAFSANDIIELIESQLNTNPTVYLKSKTTGLTYSVKIGNEYMLPIDEYDVTYESSEPIYTTTSSPTFYINETISIIAGQSIYTLHAKYSCFCVVFNLKEVVAVRSTPYDPIMIKSGEIGLTFVPNKWNKSTTSEIEFTLKVDNNSTYEQTTYKFSKNYKSGYILFELGKYYILSPNTVSKNNSTTQIEFDNWMEGVI